MQLVQLCGSRSGGYPIFLSIEEAINVVGIVVGDPLDWSVLLIGPDKGIYISFGEFFVQFYEYQFTRIAL